MGGVKDLESGFLLLRKGRQFKRSQLFQLLRLRMLFPDLHCFRTDQESSNFLESGYLSYRAGGNTLAIDGVNVGPFFCQPFHCIKMNSRSCVNEMGVFPTRFFVNIGTIRHKDFQSLKFSTRSSHAERKPSPRVVLRWIGPRTGGKGKICFSFKPKNWIFKS